jgi:hypothetical protein
LLVSGLPGKLSHYQPPIPAADNYTADENNENANKVDKGESLIHIIRVAKFTLPAT